jgi:hypothetical protein
MGSLLSVQRLLRANWGRSGCASALLKAREMPTMLIHLRLQVGRNAAALAELREFLNGVRVQASHDIPTLVRKDDMMEQ